MSEPQATGVQTHKVEIPQTRIKRKPVAAKSNWVGLPPELAKRDHNPAGAAVNESAASPSSVTTLIDGSQHLKVDDYPSPPIPIEPTQTRLTGSTLTATSTTASSTASAELEIVPDNIRPTGSSKLAKAWEETKHHAGGLIHHPSESTKHYSILRHSHGIVYYQGPETSVAVSIFADRPLPADRKIWLQQKGWTGSTGMAAKALFGANGGWLDVTPSIEATAEQLPESCERAWQRDIQKFSRKEGAKKGHTLRETCVIRIPCEAEDGYFRVVMCGDGKPKNKLCPSPIFRVLSMSMAPSSIKGASLRTLPLEVGIKIFSMVANNAVTTAMHPATAAVQNAVGFAMPNFWEREVASVAYKASGLEDKIDNANSTYLSVRGASYQHVEGVDDMVYEALDRAPLIGDDDGPSSPYPIEISSTIVPGRGAYTNQANGIPTANLRYVKEEITLSMQGLYFGWARITLDKSLAQLSESLGNAFFPIWHPAVISISMVQGASFSVAYGAKKAVAAYLIYDFGNIVMTGSKIEVTVMGFLRELIPPHMLAKSPDERIEQDSENHIADIAITQGSLARQNWSIEAVYDRKKRKLTEGETTEGGKIRNLTESITERYIDARQAAQHQVDRIPAHRAGLRRHVDTLREQALGIGGIYVKR